MGQAPQKPNQFRVLIADSDTLKYDGLTTRFQKDGIEVDLVREPEELISRVSDQVYDVAIVNLLLGGIGPFQLIAQVKKASTKEDLKVVVVSRESSRSNIQNTIRAGADDFVVEPFDPENLFQRIVYHLTPKTVVETLAANANPTEESTPYLKVLLKGVELLAKAETTKLHDAFMTILQAIASLAQSNRTSLIIVDKKSSSGVVIASSDDPNFFDFPITLTQYPEIMHVVNSGNIVLVEDVSRNWLTYKIRDKVRTIQIGSIMVFPIQYHGDIVGALTIRRPQATEIPTLEVLTVLQSIANLMGAHSNLKILLRKIYSDFAQNGS